MSNMKKSGSHAARPKSQSKALNFSEDNFPGLPSRPKETVKQPIQIQPVSVPSAQPGTKLQSVQVTLSSQHLQSQTLPTTQQQPIQQPIIQPAKQQSTSKQPIQQPIQPAKQQPIQQPIQPAKQQSIQQTSKQLQPVKQQPIQQSTQQAAQPPKQQPVQRPAQHPTQHSTQPTQPPPKQQIQQPPKQPTQQQLQSVQPANKQITQQSAQQPTQQPLQPTTQKVGSISSNTPALSQSMTMHIPSQASPNQNPSTPISYSQASNTKAPVSTPKLTTLAGANEKVPSSSNVVRTNASSDKDQNSAKPLPPPRQYSALGSREKICLYFAKGECVMVGPDKDRCSRGMHVKQDLKDFVVPTEKTVCSKVTQAKMKLIQQKWTDAGGPGQLTGVWQIKNLRLAFVYQATEHNFMSTNRQASEVIDAWHGSAEENIMSLAINGFDTSRRSGQVYGEGEYFAKNPTVSIGYCRGGSYMLLCKLLLGKSEVDHHWQADMGYYVIKHREGQVQALPLYVVQFEGRLSYFSGSKESSELTEKLKALQVDEVKQVSSVLAGKQKGRGGDKPCEGREQAGMEAASTNQIWLGWLEPSLLLLDDDEVRKDVCVFLAPLQAREIKVERNGTRVGAHVLLATTISKAKYDELCAKRYHGEFKISVDDAQKNNPRTASQVCPRWSGVTKYCRGWNLSGHHEWHKACSFMHPEDMRRTFGVRYRLEPAVQAKVDDITTNFMRDGYFHDGTPTITKIQRVVNVGLEKLYANRSRFLHDKHGFVVEKDLWHGTYVSALPEILTHGLQPPSDNAPSDLCPKSGGKGMSTTLCGTSCKFCTSAHVYRSCHMYGLGVYLADSAKKSHRYVHPIPTKPKEYSMLYCRTLLGNPYLIEGNLLSQSAMHNRAWCSNPADCLETVAEEWDLRGHDSYYVKGQSGRQKAFLGVENSEYILFQPYHILPLYLVEYTIN